MQRNRLAVFAATALLLAGCAIKKSVVKSSEATYTTSIGLTSTEDFFENSLPILTRYNFLIEKYEVYGNRYYIETTWRAGPPLPDEEQIGAFQARSRLILEAKARDTSRGSRSLNQVHMRAEAEVLFEGFEKWQRVPLTPMRKAFFKTIAEEFKLELNQGIRIR